MRDRGRFNRRGLPALCTSLTPLAAIREAQPLGRPMQPLTLCAYEVDAEPVFDALDEERRRAPGVLDSHLVCLAWEAEMLQHPCIAGTGGPPDRGGICGHARAKLRRQRGRRRCQSRNVEMGFRASGPTDSPWTSRRQEFVLRTTRAHCPTMRPALGQTPGHGGVGARFPARSRRRTPRSSTSQSFSDRISTARRRDCVLVCAAPTARRCRSGTSEIGRSRRQ